MARNKKYDQAPRPFTIKDEAKPINPRAFPAVRARQEILNDPDKRSFGANVMAQIRKSWFMPKCNSNEELMTRLDEYFEIAQERAMPPTVEQMALYCGTTSKTLYDWKTGRHKGFERTETGLDTADIVKKAYEAIAAYDAAMVQSNQMNTVGFIWLSKQHFDYRDVKQVVISQDTGSSDMSREEIEQIARNLPDGSIPTQADIK